MYYVLIAFLVLILDQTSKLWIMNNFYLGESRAVIEGVLYLFYIKNPGAAFGILQGQSWFFFIAAFIVIFLLSFYVYCYRPGVWLQVMAGLIVGGALGNGVDRVLYGSVVDFISIGWWPVFNLADMAIVCGGLLLVLLFFLVQKGEFEDAN